MQRPKLKKCLPSTLGGPVPNLPFAGYDEVGPSTADRAADVSFNQIYTTPTDAGTIEDLVATSLESVQANDTRIINACTELQNIAETHSNAQTVLGVKDLAFWANEDNATRPIKASELLDGIPAVAAAAQAWRQAFSAFCRLRNGWAGEAPDQVTRLVSMFVSYGVKTACLIDMVQLQLRTIGADAASTTLSQEATALYGLLDHLNIPDSSQRLRDLLKELKISARACVKDDKGDFEVPIRHAAANAGQPEDMMKTTPGREDVYAHLRDSGYEVHEGEMIDAVAEDEDDAMRFINPLLNGGFARDMGQEEISTALPHLGLDDVDITLGDVRSVGENKAEDIGRETGPRSPSPYKQAVPKLLKEAHRNEHARRGGPTSGRRAGADKNTGGSADAPKGGADVVSSQATEKGAYIERCVAQNEALFQLDHEAIRKQLLDGGGENLDEKIAKAGTRNRVANPQALVLPDNFQPRKGESEKWTYQLLAESKALMSMSADLVSACRMLLAAHLQNESKPLNIEWAIVIDNSGSMVRVADECVQTVVILIEALRRLECRFAVATLGDANRTRILKGLTGHFNLSVGEQILAGFTYDESSHIATGVAAVAKNVFPGSGGGAEPHERRIMLLVTDGLSQELTEKNFSDIRQKHDMELAVLHTQYGEGDYSAQNAKMLGTITNGLYFPVSLNNQGPTAGQDDKNNVLPFVLSKLVVQVLGHILKPQYTRERQTQPCSPSDAKRSETNVRRPTVDELCEELTHGRYPLRVACTDIKTALVEGAATRPADMYASSSPEASTTMIEKLEGLLDSQGIPRRSHSEGTNTFQVIKNVLKIALFCYNAVASANLGLAPPMFVCVPVGWSTGLFDSQFDPEHSPCRRIKYMISLGGVSSLDETFAFIPTFIWSGKELTGKTTRVRHLQRSKGHPQLNS